MSDVQSRSSNNFVIHKRLLQCYESNLSKYDSALLKKNHKFLWEDTTSHLTWEEELAKKYYDKLFKEFCICDLSKYKENKVALRWRTKTEVISGKGQFFCAEKKCSNSNNSQVHLRTWEVNFCYVENKETKNALVKVKLCSQCSVKLNYHSKKREVKRLKSKPKIHKKQKYQEDDGGTVSSENNESVPDSETENSNDIKEKDIPWLQKPNIEDTKSREDEMEEYLHDLLL
ncbi:hypothetical protein WA026_020809 [Henosepilachna vigintioctopunctata]|uniref:Protein FRA10AC1 n=1 Tax=Henosepilachna vigintioctopunctata TaxID=420089 RepID=A0AAW1TXE4_9CUCU